jgi:hypothetical protein
MGRRVAERFTGRGSVDRSPEGISQLRHAGPRQPGGGVWTPPALPRASWFGRIRPPDTAHRAGPGSRPLVRRRPDKGGPGLGRSGGALASRAVSGSPAAEAPHQPRSGGAEPNSLGGSAPRPLAGGFERASAPRGNKEAKHVRKQPFAVCAESLAAPLASAGPVPIHCDAMKRPGPHPFAWLAVALVGVAAVMTGLGGGGLILCVGCDSRVLDLASVRSSSPSAPGESCCVDPDGGRRASEAEVGDTDPAGAGCQCLRLRIGGDLPVMAIGAGSPAGTGAAASATPCAASWLALSADSTRGSGQRGPPPPGHAGQGRSLLTQRTCLLL